MAKLLLLLFVFHMVRLICTDKTIYTSPVVVPSKKYSNVLHFKGKSYYFDTNIKVNFFQAHRLCKQSDLELVSIESQEENERLGTFTVQIGSYHDHYWTSGNNLDNLQQWSWLSTGENIHYDNWYPGEPNAGHTGSYFDERCMETRFLDRGGFSWNNVPCDRQYFYICEEPKFNCTNT